VITVVLDDDPTGTQAVTDVAVVLDWSDPGVWTAVEPGDRAVHVLTNARAHSGAEAAELVASAATAARSRFPGARVILRGDSTLRAHVWEEYEALRSVVTPGRAGVPLLLVPALPAAGRVTVGGVHMLERDGARVVVDPISLGFVQGSEIDFVDDLIGAQFKINNPNVTASCGCGTSFSV